VLRRRNIRITLLTTGLLLERKAATVVESVDDIIVSLDGPPAIHDRIRGIPGAFHYLERGIRAIHILRPGFPITARSTVQRANYFCLRETTRIAKQLGLDSISFLAADVVSEAFNRLGGWPLDRQCKITLLEHELPILENEIAALFSEWGDSGFLRETRQKLDRIALHFRAHLGLREPVAPACNAPWVSAVIESDGTVRPCFFHRPIGKLNGQSLFRVLNSTEALDFRSRLDVGTNPVCRRCVCSLNLPR
jgi:Fe-coproporphyrin III synthase